MLSVTGITRNFYGVRALDGVTFHIRPGSFTGLIGPNGAGKSTLFNVVSGLFRPETGRVVFDDQDITAHTPEQVVGRGLVRTFQLARGFPKLTVYQHLMLYGQGQPGESLWAALLPNRAAQQHERALHDRAWEIAQRLKLDHVMNNPVTALSGGQKKLVEIGRALMAQPKMLLLDEPMAGVNPTLTAQIAQHLVDLNREGMTICLIEHDMAVIKNLCDPVIVMADGATLTQGTFEDVVANEAVREAYLGKRA